MPDRLRRWLPWAIAVLAVVARLIPGPRIIDDAYITFRYAQNLLAGYGFVYNPGETVLGTTTPLYTLLMAGLAAPFGGEQAPFPEIAWLLNAALDAAGCLVLIELGRSLRAEIAGLFTALIWAVAPMSVTFAIGGMETSLFILILLAMFLLALRSRWYWAAGLAALALLARPDGLLFVAPLALERLRLFWNKRSEGTWKSTLPVEAALLLAPLGLWTLFAATYFGSPIPHSVTAKVAAYILPPDAALTRLLQHYATPFLGHLTFGIWWIGVGLILYPVLFLLGAAQKIREMPSSWALFSTPFIYLLAYAAANPLIFRWYLAPPLPFYFLGIMVGGQRVAADLRAPRPLLALGVAALALTVVGWEVHPDHGPDRPAPRMAFIQLELLYEQAGRDLHDQLEEGEVVAAADIGAIGYYSEAKILDTLGIISPESLIYYPVDPDLYAINYAIPSQLIHDLEPNRLVILEVYGRRTLLMDAEFVSRYRLNHTIPTDIYGSQGMMLFTRVEKP